MKAGDRFNTVSAFEQVLGDKFPMLGFLKMGFIKHLTEHSDFSCARHNFYSNKFPNKNPKSPQMWWSEFQGVERAETLKANWNDSDWLAKTKIVHEIYSPLEVPSKPGALPKKNIYHPQDIISDGLTKRLILGNLPGGYVFLGVYELQETESLAFSNINAYSVDATSFPSNFIVAKMQANPIFPQSHIAAKQSNLITYPHCVWKRISDVWEE